MCLYIQYIIYESIEIGILGTSDFDKFYTKKFKLHTQQ